MSAVPGPNGPPDASHDAPLDGAHHQALFEANPHATFLLSLEGRFLDVNATTADLSGYDRDHLLGSCFSDLVVGDDLGTAGEAFSGAVDGEPQKAQVTITTAAGAAMDLNVAVVPVVVADEVVGVAGLAEDVTVGNAMRRELEAARVSAEQADAAKSLFLANMSHEVRTPLTSVLAVTEMLAEGELDDEQQQLVEVARRSGHRLMLLVEDILDVSRLETGRLRLEQVDLAVGELVEEVAAWAAPMAERRGLAFSHEVQASAPQRLCGDPERISQVLTNLVANAVKFTDAGAITLTVGGCQEGSAGPTVRFVVADTGVGIPPEHLTSLFEPFTQLDPSRTRRHGGAGLGLAICRDLVRLMQGTLTAASTVGSGSSFTVTLPVDRPGERP